MVNLSEIAFNSAWDVIRNPDYIRKPNNSKEKPGLEFDGKNWVCYDRENFISVVSPKPEKAYELYQKVNTGQIKTGREHTTEYTLLHALMCKGKLSD